MRFTTVAIAGLATMRIIETAKEASPVIPPPWFKSGLAGAVAVGLLSTTDAPWTDRLVAAGAAAGLAGILHDVAVGFGVWADAHRASILVRNRGVGA